ncbi:hypothetical protein MOQ72_27960 [Saccharopolyspora sp. K220]|uniref:hypothetical protein n=1 Tax=Saccharopolyspora soli TaxID=2926618 RepID=UPI001F58EE75|nr:hypothetical protein [Saccharopolyspora soli]MCI2421284.1 hypothetical protein [Saccharopolyspora soli]
MRDDSRHDQLVEELRLLLDALAGKAEEYLRGCGASAEADSKSGCGWCPLCAAVALLRGQRPDLNDQLLGIVQALRQMLVDQHPAASEEDSPEEPAEPKVQRIRVRRVDGRVLAEDDVGAVPRC